MLLDEPELIHAIVVPDARRRAGLGHGLGQDAARLHGRQPRLDCARAIHAAGASEIVVHACAIWADGYKPRPTGERIAAVREVAPAHRQRRDLDGRTRCLARERSGCETPMLGRAWWPTPPWPASWPAAQPLPWAEVLPLLAGYLDLVRAQVAPGHQAGRIKQWLHYLRRHYARPRRSTTACARSTAPTR